MRKLILAALVSIIGANAQAISVGLLAGVPFTDAIKTTTINSLAALPTSTNFVYGPTLQINLPKKFRIEVDALHRPVGFTLGPLLNLTASEWRIPILLQYRMGPKSFSPFIEGGVSYDHISGLSAILTTIKSGPGTLLNPSQASVVLGAGIDIKIPVIRRISAELRFTRQSVAQFQDISNLNQAEVLVGFHF